VLYKSKNRQQTSCNDSTQPKVVSLNSSSINSKIKKIYKIKEPQIDLLLGKVEPQIILLVPAKYFT